MSEINVKYTMKCHIHKRKAQCRVAMAGYILPRTDNEMLDIPNDQLLSQETCPLVYLKKLIIRCRRRFRQEDFDWFKHFVDHNLDFLLQNLTSRWLNSVSDTYIDCGSDVEKANAMIISTFISQEKIAHSLFIANNFKKKKKIETKKQEHLWGNIYSLQFDADDLVYAFYRRMFKTLKSTPSLHSIFKTIVMEMLNSNSGIISKVPYGWDAKIRIEWIIDAMNDVETPKYKIGDSIEHRHNGESAEIKEVFEKVYEVTFKTGNTLIPHWDLEYIWKKRR